MARGKGPGSQGGANRGVKRGGKALRETQKAAEDSDQTEEIEELRDVEGEKEKTESEVAEGAEKTMAGGPQNTEASDGTARGKEPAEEARGKRAGHEESTEEHDSMGDLVGI